VDELTARSRTAPAQLDEGRDEDLLQVLGRTLDELADLSPAAVSPGER
jgi:hypothetical protein